jgi:hemolysin activation/secretion protein
MATVMLQAILAMEPVYSCISILLSLCLVCLSVGAQAQERLGGEPPGRSGLPSLPTLEDQPSKPAESPILPPLPPPAPAERQRLPQQVRIFVRQIRVEGNTVFPREKLEEITKRYVDRELTTEDLEALRLELTRLYVDAGYINSGAVIPDQTVSEGVITYQIIEGGTGSV